MKSLLILGRQPELSLAELESLYGPDSLEPISHEAVIVDVDPCLLAFKRLGGSLKFCKLLSIQPTADWLDVEKFLIEVAPAHSAAMPEGKMQLGLSLYGFSMDNRAIAASGLRLKQAIQKTGRSIRFIPNKSAALNSAQIIHNKLTGPNGWELVIIRSGEQTFIAQTVMVQDIESYTERDFERPKRDARVGMLPPKLAQIIINLAVGRLAEDKLKSICDIPADQAIPPPDLDQIILDPFCGTGVIAQEASLMGYRAYATDIEARMVEFTSSNLKWLSENFELNDTKPLLAVADATTNRWQKFDFVASEAFLGKPFAHLPSSAELDKEIKRCNDTLKKFLVNLGQQIAPGSRICLAVPAWQIRPKQLKSLPLIDQIRDLGYNEVKFKHSGNGSLAYYRDQQVVARQLLVLTKEM